jgi:hypothetical protein
MENQQANNPPNTSKRCADESDMPAQPAKRRVLPWNVPKQTTPEPTPKRVVKQTRSNIKKTKATLSAKAKEVTPSQTKLENSRRRDEAALALIELSRSFSVEQAALVLMQLSQSDDTMEGAHALLQLSRSEDRNVDAHALMMVLQSGYVMEAAHTLVMLPRSEDVMEAASALFDRSTANLDTHEPVSDADQAQPVGPTVPNCLHAPHVLTQQLLSRRNIALVLIHPHLRRLTCLKIAHHLHLSTLQPNSLRSSSLHNGRQRLHRTLRASRR